MAARKKVRHTEDVRAKIQASQLINFLQMHVFNGTDIKKTQVTAALGLLKKTIPDLQSVEGTMNLHHHHEDALKELE